MYGYIRTLKTYIKEFFNQETTKGSRTMPDYYRHALAGSEAILSIYFLMNLFLLHWGTGKWFIMPPALLCGILICLASNGRVNIFFSFYGFAAVILCWTIWYIRTFGWEYGGQHFLVVLLLLQVFNIYEKPWKKMINAMLLLCIRMCLFVYTISHMPVIALNQRESIGFQMFNSLTFYVMLAFCFVIFSSNIQKEELHLLLDNEKLQRQADTDPLTKLPNRRPMMERLQEYSVKYPKDIFSIGIADIDHFKQVNDTYGHACGDYVLQKISEKFLSASHGQYSVCRWGGEEFCFFLPGKNLDEAKDILFDVHLAVGKMNLDYKEETLHITVTIGIAENDFRSSLEELLDEADRKLYMGKINGRNQIVA